ncbi:CpaD family pilus assembly protein [Sphingomonas japonica]|nr:CpaD family pilus assembly protein [Sphingomonas japonica]
MTNYAPIAAILGSALLLASCGGTANRGLESVHQPVVSRGDYAFDLRTDGGGLAAGEAERLAGWMASMRLGYGDRVAIDDGGAYSELTREAVAGEAARYGLLLAEAAPVTPGAIAPGTARVVVTRMTATVPGCPDFSRINGPNFDSHTYSNQGCSVNSNFAAMVARPEDLVRGQPGADAIDPATAVKAIRSYRAAAPTGQGGQAAEAVSTTQGGQ